MSIIRLVVFPGAYVAVIVHIVHVRAENMRNLIIGLTIH